MRLLSIRTTAILASAIVLSACGAIKELGAHHPTSSEKPIIPEFLKDGDKVAIVSPSYKIGPKAIEATDSILRSWGLVPVIGDSYYREAYLGRYAGTDKERAREFRQAYSDPDIKAVLCARGGYGALHFLGMFPDGMFRKNPKWLIGFSDITTLLNWSAAQGVAAIHGAMCDTFRKEAGADTSCVSIRQILFGQLPQYSISASQNDICGKAEGIVIGGNLSTLHPLLGTEADPFRSGEDIILFIEEIGESYHSIDRMMCILRNHGAFEHVKGIMFGAFKNCDPDLECGGIEGLMREFVEPLGIPVCWGLSFGHTRVNLPLVTGAKAKLVVSGQGSRLEY